MMCPSILFDEACVGNLEVARGHECKRDVRIFLSGYHLKRRGEHRGYIKKKYRTYITCTFQLEQESIAMHCRAVE